MARVRCVLFDIDGTLLDSNDAHAHAWQSALFAHGCDAPSTLIRTMLGSEGGRGLLDRFGILPRSPLESSILARRAQLFSRCIGELGPFRGARVLVDRLRSRGLVCCAVSCAESTEVHALLDAAGIDDLIDVLVTGDDDRAESHALEIALERVGVSPSESVYVGDAPADIALGLRAGVAVIALRCGGVWRDQDFEGASAIYDDPEDLSHNLDRSPLALDRGSAPAAVDARERTALPIALTCSR